jgi:hypothetical protein
MSLLNANQMVKLKEMVRRSRALGLHDFVQIAKAIRQLGQDYENRRGKAPRIRQLIFERLSG